MANYQININNDLYQVIDCNTKRIIASFVTENDAKSFMHRLYDDLLQKSKDIISNKYFLDAFVKSEVNNNLFTNESSNFLSDKNSENNSIIDEIEKKIDKSEDKQLINDDKLYDNNGEIFLRKMSNLPLDYLQIIINNESIIDDIYSDENKLNNINNNEVRKKIINEDVIINKENSLDKEKDKKFNKKSKIVTSETEVVEDFESINNVSQDLEIEVVDDHTIIDNNSKNSEEEIADDNFLDLSELESMQNEMIIDDNKEEYYDLFSDYLENNNDNLTAEIELLDSEIIEPTFETFEPENLDNNKFVSNELKNENPLKNHLNNLKNYKIKKDESEIVSVNNNEKGIIDLGPIQEEDDIYNFSKKDMKTDIDFEKAILAGEATFLPKRQQKKYEKMLKKQKKVKK